MLLDKPDLSKMDLPQFLAYARQIHLQQTPKSRRAAAKRVKFHPLPFTLIRGETDTIRVNEYKVLLDGRSVTILGMSHSGMFVNPRWKFDSDLVRHLKLRLSNRGVHLPLNHCKALLKHVFTNQVPTAGMDLPQIHRLADFARQREIEARQTRKSRK